MPAEKTFHNYSKCIAFCQLEERRGMSVSIFLQRNIHNTIDTQQSNAYCTVLNLYYVKNGQAMNMLYLSTPFNSLWSTQKY